jgi:Protein of unknown function (DUF2975)
LFYNNFLPLQRFAMLSSSPSTDLPAIATQASQSRHLWVGWFFAVLAVALPVAVLMYGLSTPLAAQLQAAGLPMSIAQSAQAGGAMHVQLMLLALLPVAGLSYALWQAGRCSRAFARGQAFARDAVSSLRQCALGMLLAAVASLVLPSLSGLLLTWHLSAGPRSLVVSLNSQALILLAFAALVGQMASVLRQGAALAEENAQFV